MKMTKARVSVFLKVLSETASTTAAASAATPDSTERHGGLQSFRDERARNPEFAAAWQRAEEEALAAVEQAIWDRALNPPVRPIWSRGEVVGQVEDRNSSDRLLLRLASKLSPEWREKSQVEAQVSVQHAVLAITPADICLLVEAKQEQLLELLGEISAKKGGDDDGLQRLSSERATDVEQGP